MGTSPIADDLHGPDADPEAQFPLTLQVCQRCWLAQLGYVVPSERLYGPGYAFYTGGSPAAVRYYAEYARWLKGMDVLSPGDLVVEVACNDGTLLRHFADGETIAVGVEPSDGPADVAEGRGLDVIVAPFGLRVAIGVRKEYGRAKVIIANNVLAHVDDLADMLGGIRALLRDDGVFVAEVQYLPDLLLGNAFDHLYHQHRSFFTLDSLARALSEHGLVVQSVMWTPAQGGSIRVTAGPGAPGNGSVRQLRAAESWLREPAGYAGLQGRAERLRARILDAVWAEHLAGRNVVGLGASAKGTTLLNWCGFTRSLVSAVHDRTPSKDGLAIPGTAGIPITTTPLPAPAETTALILAHNYLPSILADERQWHADGGRFLVPIPAPVVL